MPAIGGRTGGTGRQWGRYYVNAAWDTGSSTTYAGLNFGERSDSTATNPIPIEAYIEYQRRRAETMQRWQEYLQGMWKEHMERSHSKKNKQLANPDWEV